METEKTVPVGYVPEGIKPIDKPFVLNWAEKGAASKLRDATDKASDTCFSEMLSAGHVSNAESETVSTTLSSLGGELADTSLSF